MAQHVRSAKRLRNKKVWKLSAVIALVAVSFNLALAESTVRFVPDAGDEPASETLSIESSTTGAIADTASTAAATGTEIRIISPSGQSTVSVRKVPAANNEAAAKSQPTVTQNSASTAGKVADRSNVGSVVIRSVTSGQADLMPKLTAASSALASNESAHIAAPTTSSAAAPVKSEAPDLFSRLFAITAKESSPAAATAVAKTPAPAATDAEDLGPGLRLTQPKLAENQKPAPVVARTEPAKASEVAITRPSPAKQDIIAAADRPFVQPTQQPASKAATPKPEMVAAKTVGPDLFGALQKEAVIANLRPSTPVAIVAPQPEIEKQVVANNSPAKSAEPVAKIEAKPAAPVATQQPASSDRTQLAKQEPKPAQEIARSLAAAVPSPVSDVNAMPLPAISKTVAAAPVVEPPRKPAPIETKVKVAEAKPAPAVEQKPAQVVVIPATSKALESMIAANSKAAAPAPALSKEPISAPPVVAPQPAPAVVAAAPVVVPPAPAAPAQVVASTPVASITPTPANNDWTTALQAQPQPSEERVASASPRTTAQPASDYVNDDMPRTVGKFAHSDVQKPLVTLAQDSPKPVRTDYAMLQLTSPSAGSHGAMAEPMPNAGPQPVAGPAPMGVEDSRCGCGPTGCPYRPLQSGEQNICGVDCGNCAAPCSAMWKDSQCIPWSLFGPGEYVGPARTEHVSTYFLRVNDVITLTFISSHRKEAERYRIGCGDRLKLEWLRSPQDTDRSLDREVLVQPDGSIALPLVGEVNASGKTVQELQDELTKAFGKFQRDPQITITPMDFNLAQKDIIAAVTSVSGSNGQTQALKVTPEGTIQAPGVGSVFVQGLTLDELRNELESRYLAAFGPGLLISPSLTQRAPMFTFVGGEVTKPGRYELEGPTTVMQAITLAGGWNVGGNLHQVVVFRRDENWCLKATKIDIRAPFYGQDPCPANDVWLRDNDLVIVPKSRILCATDAIQLYFTRGIYAVFPITYVYDFSKSSAVVVP